MVTQDPAASGLHIVRHLLHLPGNRLVALVVGRSLLISGSALRRVGQEIDTGRVLGLDKGNGWSQSITVTLPATIMYTFKVF